jgi:hypothetical protein
MQDKKHPALMRGDCYAFSTVRRGTGMDRFRRGKPTPTLPGVQL